jgi:hypothetical protein
MTFFSGDFAPIGLPTAGTYRKMFGALATVGLMTIAWAPMAAGETLDTNDHQLTITPASLDPAEILPVPEQPQLQMVEVAGYEGSGQVVQTAPATELVWPVVVANRSGVELPGQLDGNLLIAADPAPVVPSQEPVTPGPTTDGVPTPLPVVAEPKKWGVGVRANASTLGFFGVDAGYRFTDNLHARLGFDVGGFGYNTSNSGVDYDANLSLANVHLLGDYFPFGGGGLRLTGGLIFQGNRLSGNAKPSGTGTVNLGGQTYSLGTNQQITNIGSEAAFDSGVAPYIGIGFGTPISPGLSFNADLGVMFPGSPTVRLNPTLSAATLGNAALTNEINTQVQKQQDATNRDISGFSVYPVLSIGLSYAF